MGYYDLQEVAKHSFNLNAANHQIILTSRTCESKVSAENGIGSVRKHGGEDGNFVLEASNGQVIGTSEMYESETARDNGIDW